MNKNVDLNQQVLVQPNMIYYLKIYIFTFCVANDPPANDLLKQQTPNLKTSASFQVMFTAYYLSLYLSFFIKVNNNL